MMFFSRRASVACLIVVFIACAESAIAQTVTGELKQWHTVEITFTGPSVDEADATNPFTDYRMDVLFTDPDGNTHTRPGFFAADGDAANTGATGGDKWRVRFMPDRIGVWQYSVSFETGADVATASAFGTGTTTSFHAATGNVTVGPSDKTGRDFRAPKRGLIKNRGGHYLTFPNGDVWVKGGPDIPENFFGYYGFDNTASGNSRGPNYGGDPNVPSAENRLHRFPNHVQHWNAGDPDWTRNDGDASTQPNAGRAIIGALNDIASTGANSIYFLPMNLGGDGQDTYPFNATGNKTRYDVSKLAQWQIVYQHAQTKGIFLHFVLAETESGNENFFDSGALGPQRMLFFRELIARFGAMPGLQFNVGEENDFGTALHVAFAAALKALDDYDHPVTTHTKTNKFSNFYTPLLGNADYDMTSFQTNRTGDTIGDDVESWRTQSANAGVPWVISVDEPQRIDNDENDTSIGYPTIRRRFSWPVYLSGGGGLELYIQQDGGGHGFDQEIEDFAQMQLALNELGHALSFLELLPLNDMSPDDELVRGEDPDHGGAQVLAEEGNVYAIYIPDASNDDNADNGGGPPELDLRNYAGREFKLRWYNPRTGQFVGDTTTLTGGAWTSLGATPDGIGNTDDWVAYVVVPDASNVEVGLAPCITFDGVKGCLYEIVRIDAFGHELTVGTVEAGAARNAFTDTTNKPLEPSFKYEVRLVGQ